MRVLCVDDDPDAADTLAALLEIAGFVPRTCYDAALALALAKEFRPDACLLDLTMPGLNGWDLARQLREWAGPRPIPLVAVTGLDGDDARRATADAGFDLFLTKPVDPDTLSAVLADIVILRGDLWADHESPCPG
jgi:DNA-binding response OmpR family regulator